MTVGVTFVSGTFVLSDTMVKAFDELYDGLTAGTDVVVKSEAAFDADVATTGGQVRPLDQGLVRRVQEVPGVAVAEGAVSGFALVIDRHGEPVQPGGAPTIGTSLTEDRRLAGAATFRAGRTPSGPHELALDARTARSAGYALGDTVDVVLQDGRRSLQRWSASSASATPTACWGPPSPGSTCPRLSGRSTRWGSSTRSTCWPRRAPGRRRCVTGSPRCCRTACRR